MGYASDMDNTEHYARVADDFARVLGGVTDWSASSPCPEWNAHQLAAHVVDTHRRILSRLDGAEPPVLADDADVPKEWTAVRADVEKAMTEQGDTPVDAFTGKQPFADFVGSLLCADTLVHTWDLARASKQDDSLDLTAVSKAQAFLQPMGDMMRSPGGFGEEVAVPEGASAQDRLVAFCGRNPEVVTT
jgi:uncharacterized protein (TIGR03086 family)